jgi:hypothetical protein
LNELEEDEWALLYGEAVRRDPGSPVAKKLSTKRRHNILLTPSVAAFVATGQPDVDFLDAPYEVRAAAELARSRVASLKPVEKKQLRERARDDDLTKGLVTTAIDAWK